MPKIKTNKTLSKRVKITKKGKILRKQTRTGHLKVKWSSTKKMRKNKKSIQENKGHRKIFRKLLAASGRKVK